MPPHRSVSRERRRRGRPRRRRPVSSVRRAARSTTSATVRILGAAHRARLDGPVLHPAAVRALAAADAQAVGEDERADTPSTSAWSVSATPHGPSPRAPTASKIAVTSASSPSRSTRRSISIVMSRIRASSASISAGITSTRREASSWGRSVAQLAGRLLGTGHDEAVERAVARGARTAPRRPA